MPFPLKLCRRVEEIEASRAPQILTIDHYDADADAAVELSDIDDGSESTDNEIDTQSDSLSHFDSLGPQSTLPAINSGTYMSFGGKNCIQVVDHGFSGFTRIS
jgi:hypothetical protein